MTIIVYPRNMDVGHTEVTHIILQAQVHERRKHTVNQNRNLEAIKQKKYSKFTKRQRSHSCDYTSSPERWHSTSREWRRSKDRNTFLIKVQNVKICRQKSLP